MSSPSDDPEITHQRLSLTLGNGDERFIEKILDVFIENGGVIYLIKWEGFSDDHCTWEHEHTLSEIPGFKALAKEFKLKRAETEAREQLNKEEPECAEAVGFDRGLPPQKILSTCMDSGELCFLLKWKYEGEPLADVVTAKEACKRCPELVVEYCERLYST